MDDKNLTQAVTTFSDHIKAEKLRETEVFKQHTPKLKAHTVGILPGDGIGPRLITQAQRVLSVIMAPEIEAGEFNYEEISGCTIENRIATGEAVPKNVMEKIRQYPVLLKGPMMTPKATGEKVQHNVESANAFLRRNLDLYAAIRPMTLSKTQDWTFFRENIEGPYLFGSKGIQVDDQLAIDIVVQTKFEVQRLAKRAFEYAKSHGKTDIAVVTKANIVKLTDGNFLKICQEVGKSYPDISVTPYFVDAMAANLHDDSFNQNLQVIVLPNLYGDIITDIAAQLQGGLGSAGSANVGDHYAIFEAIHGTAPWLFEHHLEDYADPRSLLRAVVMLLEHLNYREQASWLTDALDTLSGDDQLPNFDHQVTTVDYVNKLISVLNVKQGSTKA